MPKINQIILTAGTDDVLSAPVETTGLSSLKLDVTITLAASPLTATTLTPRGANALNAAGALVNPLPLVGGAIITATPTGITLSNGVLTFAAVGVTTARLTLAYDPKLLPRWVVWDWVYGSGDAAVALSLFAAGW